MRAKKMAVGFALLGAALLGGTTALDASASTPAAGAIKLFSNPTASGASGTVLIVGAIGDHGKYVAADKNGTQDPNGHYMKVLLKNGTFEVNVTALADNRQTPYKATCSAIFSGTSASAVLNGTGLYAGIKGTLQVTTTHVLLSSRHTTGPKKAQCNHANVIAEYDSLTATGHVSFG